MRTIPDLVEEAIKLFKTGRQLAIACGVTHPTILRARRGLCSPDLAGRIERATQGKITRQELRPDIFGVAPPDIERRQHRKEEETNV